MVLRKDQIEASLLEEHQLILSGKLKEDNPLDLSESFSKLCECCRRGDTKGCQELITEGTNINARDGYDYTPLILASLCGHYEVVELLLESGALCERDTFQGERCLYNALNDRIRNLLLSYDYSKSTDPLQPFAFHVASLLTRRQPRTSDIIVVGAEGTFHLHKFILSARSPYFAKKLCSAPETTSWKLPPAIPFQAFDVAIRYIYLGELPNDVGGGPGTGFSEDEVLESLDKVSRQLEIRSLWDSVIEGGDRRVARQRRTDELDVGRHQIEGWFIENVLKHKVTLDYSMADNVKWDCNNGIFADVLLRADEPEDNAIFNNTVEETLSRRNQEYTRPPTGIPVGPMPPPSSRSTLENRKSRNSVLFPVHRAMLIRSEFFSTMFSSGFREAQTTEYLHIIPIDCSPDVLEAVLRFLYTEKANFPLGIAIGVLFAADLLLIEKLKLKAAVIISSLGNGSMLQISERPVTSGKDLPVEEELEIYDVVRAGWLTRVPKLEEFGARYLAYRLENYIDEEEFADLVRESAARIQGRQETDTIELLDDIRYFLSERYRLRFEDSGIEDMMKGDSERDSNVRTSQDKWFTGDNASVDVRLEPSFYHASAQYSELLDNQVFSGTIRTLNGDIAPDEMEQESKNYQILLGKIEQLLDRLKLDA